MKCYLLASIEILRLNDFLTSCRFGVAHRLGVEFCVTIHSRYAGSNPVQFDCIQNQIVECMV